MVTELSEFCSDNVLSPHRILLPHPADEGSGVRIDGRVTSRSPGTMSQQQPPERTMPANHGFGADDDDGVQQGWEDLGDGSHAPAVARHESRTRCTSLEDDDLLAEQRVLGDELGTPAEDVADHAKAGLDELVAGDPRLIWASQHRKRPSKKPSKEE